MGDDYEEAPPRARKPGGSNHSTASKKKRAGGSKSPTRVKRPPQRPPGAAAKNRANSPQRPSPSSSHGPRKPMAQKGKPQRPPNGSNAIPKGSGKGPQGRRGGPKIPASSQRSRSSSGDEYSSSEELEDKFDEDALSRGPTTASGRNARARPANSNHSRGASNHSRGGNNRPRGATIRSDHSRGTGRPNPPPGSSSNHTRGTQDESGAIIPYEESDAFDSFHGDEDEYADNNRAIVPVGDYDDYDDDYDDGYDQSKLRPPPKVKLAREDSDLGEFPHDKWWQKCLRHFRILTPHPQEDDLKKQVRYLIWTTLILDVLVAVVSIATFGDGVTQCCGTAVMAAGIDINWDLFMQVVTWIYLIGIFLEIHPVVREGPIPWNLLNPAFGFLISFAVFVDDSKGEAISIWILEVCSVMLELVTFRKLKQLHNRKVKRLEELEGDIANEKYSHGYRKTAFLRERRETRLIVSESDKKLRYHFIGATVNAALVSVTLLLIIFVARGGGMCLVGGVGESAGLDIFNPDQKARCTICGDENGWTDKCIKCKNEGTEYEEPDQCYFPYF